MEVITDGCGDVPQPKRGFISTMTGAEIAKQLGITRQAVSSALKNSLRKIYYKLQEKEPLWSPFDIVIAMMLMLNADTGGDDDVKQFFNLLPADIRKVVREDANKRNLYEREILT